MCCDSGNPCAYCARSPEENLSSLDLAAAFRNWYRVAQLAEPHLSTVMVSEEDRPALDAALFQRGLVTWQEPGRPALLIVPIEDVLIDNDLTGFAS